MACGRIVAFREVVVKSVLWCGCGCCGVGAGVRVEWVLPWRGWDVFRGSAGVFFLEMVLQDFDDLGWGCSYGIGGGVSKGLELWLVFCVGL